MNTRFAAALGAAIALTGVASAQDSAAPKMNKEQQAMMAAMERMGEVRPEHKRLEYFVGDWKTTTTMWMDPKAPPQTSAGKAHVVSKFGGRYIETSYEGDMMGQKFEGEGVLGYDNLGGKFFNTWMDSGSTGFWLAYGSYDQATNSYTFQGRMDDAMAPGTKVAVREVVHIVDPGHYTFTWYETRKGKEAKTMQIEYSKL